jgi:polyisoprenoid-binding protein YceI
MKYQNSLLSILAVFAFTFFSFIYPASEDKSAVSYKVDPFQSVVVWKGKKIAGEHTGTINLQKGSIITDGNNIVGGEFIFDMKSIKNTDLSDPSYNKKLVDHLKSDDFFSTSNFGTSLFTIKQVIQKGGNSFDVTGDLTIKNITHEIDFPATIKEKDNDIVVNALVIVDRSKYNVQFGSGSFFQNLGDNLIYDDFELDINIVAEKILAKNN